MIERVGVAGALVAEQVAITVLPVGIGDEPIPVVMADFMTEMAKQGAIGFVQLHAHRFTVCVVGFFDVQGDQAVGMACGWQVALQIDTDEVEGQAGLFVDSLGNDLQAQGDQLRDQTTFGRLDLAPAFAVFNDREVGNGAIEAARNTEFAGIMLWKKPVTGCRGAEVGATPIQPGTRLIAQAPGSRLRPRFERSDTPLLRQVAQRCRTGQALGIGEKHRLATGALPDLAVTFGFADKWGGDA